MGWGLGFWKGRAGRWKGRVVCLFFSVGCGFVFIVCRVYLKGVGSVGEVVFVF